MKYLILFIIVTTTYFKLNEACEKNQVVIQNQLGPGRILEYHCRSKDNDLGIHTMNFNDTPFIIRFHDEIINLTRWACILRQGIFFGYSFDVEVYKAGPRLIPRCGQLRVWVAKVDGIYWSNKSDKSPVRVLSWNNFLPYTRFFLLFRKVTKTTYAVGTHFSRNGLRPLFGEFSGGDVRWNDRTMLGTISRRHEF